LEAFTFAGSGNINNVTSLEDRIAGNLITNLISINIIYS